MPVSSVGSTFSGDVKAKPLRGVLTAGLDPPSLGAAHNPARTLSGKRVEALRPVAVEHREEIVGGSETREGRSGTRQSHARRD